MTTGHWRLKRPYQLRIGRDTEHYDSYPAALEAFHATMSADEDREYEITLWERSPSELEWFLVTLAHPWNETPHCSPSCGLCGALDRGLDTYGLRHQEAKPLGWVNLFAGRTLSSLFFLTKATRRTLDQLGWPAPPDAVGWKYTVTTDSGEDVLIEDNSLNRVVDPDKDEEDMDVIDLVSWSQDPACRVDQMTLERRINMGWDLDRAMRTPMLGFGPGDRQEYYIEKKKNGRVRRRPLPKI
jgi:hypothetical protein